MDRFLYIASGGAADMMRAQAVNANNLANANTVGFRQDLAVAQALQLHGPGYSSRAFVESQGMGSNLAPGAVMSTGRELDVAIQGEGWLAVQAVDGTEAYTRAGNLRVSPAGLLTNAAGHPVIGNSGGPITLPPFSKIEIGGDGTISLVPQGQSAATMAVIDRIKMVNPDPSQIQKSNDGLFRSKDGVELAGDGATRLISGALESSNVNVVESMIKTMELARRFEMQIKVMEQAKELDAASAQLMKLS